MQSESMVKCDDYMEEYSQCARGIPVSPLFGHYYCTGNHEHCPLRLWVKTLPATANVIRPRKQALMRRKA